jgi:hypothetical protein
MATITSQIGTALGSAGSGTISVTSGTTAVTGVSTSFLSEIGSSAPFQTIAFGGNTYNVLSVASDTSLTLGTNSSTTESGSSYTLGSRNYTSVAAWEASGYGGAGGTDDARGEMYADSDFDEGPTLNNNTPQSILLRAAAGERHSGVAASAEGDHVRMRYTGTARTLSWDVAVGENASLQWVEFDGNGGTYRIDAQGQSVGQVGEVSHCLAHDSTAASGGHYQGFIYALTRDVLTHNNLIYDFARTTTLLMRGLSLDSDRTEGGAFNNIIDRIDNTGTGNAEGFEVASNTSNGTVINNAISSITTSGGSGTTACFGFSGTSTVTDTNVSDDATADDADSASETNYINQTYADMYTSTVNGSENYKPQDASSPLITNSATTPGAVPGGYALDADDVAIDIEGNDRGTAAASWYIGCFGTYTGTAPFGYRPLLGLSVGA